MVTISVVTTSFKKPDFSVPELSNTNSSSARGGTLCPPLPSNLGTGLAWAYISLVHAVTAAMSSYDHNCYIQKKVSYSYPLSLALRIYLTPFPWRLTTFGCNGHSNKVTEWITTVPIDQCISQPSFLQQITFNPETHSWPVCRKWETWKFSALCRISILHSCSCPFSQL